MADEQLFRTAISGFNKEDVIAYIDGINRAAAENQDWFDRQSKAMADTIKRLTKENNKLKSAGDPAELEKLQQQLETQAQECAELREQLKKAEAALKNVATGGDAQLRGRLEEFMKEREGMQRQLSQANAQVANLQNQCDQYRKALEEVRQKILRTQNQSDNELKAALVQAQTELSQANTRADQLQQALDSARAVGAAAPAGDPQLQARLDEALRQTAQAQQQLDDARAQLEQTRQQAARQIDELTLQNRQLTEKANGVFAGSTSNYAVEMRLREAQERIVSLESEVARLRNENEYLQLNSISGGEDLRTLYDKSRLYDDIKNNVAKILTDARKKAADIVGEADLSSRQILQQGLTGLSQMQSRIRAMKKEIETAQQMYSDTSINMSSMFSSIMDAVNITDNQLISILGSNASILEQHGMAVEQQSSSSRQDSSRSPQRRRTTGQEDIWRNQPL